jgi:hypothetical protein
MAKQVIIDYIYFHFVDREKPIADLDSGGYGNISSDAQESYTAYIKYILSRGDSDKAYNIFMEGTTSANQTKGKLDSMLRRPIPSEKNEFEASAKELTSHLLVMMKKVSNARPGVLFYILHRIDGKRHLCILKLKSVSTEFFDYNKLKSDFEKYVYQGKLPVKGNFQKGAIYPHPSLGLPIYMRLYQKDDEAHYFEEFLGGYPEVSTADLLANLTGLGRAAAKKPVKYPQVMGLYEGVKAHLGGAKKAVKAVDAIRVISQSFPSANRAAIKDLVDKKFTKSGIIDPIQLDNQRIEFSIGNIIIRGSLIELSERFKYEGKRRDSHIIDGPVTGVKIYK